MYTYRPQKYCSYNSVRKFQLALLVKFKTCGRLQQPYATAHLRLQRCWYERSCTGVKYFQEAISVSQPQNQLLQNTEAISHILFRQQQCTKPQSVLSMWPLFCFSVSTQTNCCLRCKPLVLSRTKGHGVRLGFTGSSVLFSHTNFLALYCIIRSVAILRQYFVSQVRKFAVLKRCGEQVSYWIATATDGSDNRQGSIFNWLHWFFLK